MLRLCEKLEVLDSVVSWSFVDMMDIMEGRDLSIRFLPNESMPPYLPSFNKAVSIASVVELPSFVHRQSISELER